MKKKITSRDLQLAEDWQWFASTPQGRRVIADLMTWGNVYSQIEENDPVAMARAIGENNYAKRIALLLGLSPAVFPVKSWEDTDILERMLSSNNQLQ